MNDALDPSKFTLKTLPDRVSQLGDLAFRAHAQGDVVALFD